MKLKPLLTVLIIGMVVLGILAPIMPGPSNKLPTIAITQIVDHPSLDEARQGIIDTLANAGYIQNRTLNIVYDNPQGNMITANQIAQKLVHMDLAAIVPISTNSAQTVIAANKNHIPVVFSSAATPLESQLVQNLEAPENHITGASDAAPMQAQLQVIRAVLPHAKTIGVLYNASESNSQATIKQLKHFSEHKIIDIGITSTTDIPDAIQSLMGKVDVIYLPSDNMIWSAMGSLIQITNKNKVPVLTSDPDSALRGVSIAVGYTQYDVGVTAGQKLVKILNGHQETPIPVTTPEHPRLFINLKAANTIGLDIPAELIQQADHIIT